mgnify:CR=1 FL=1
MRVCMCVWNSSAHTDTDTDIDACTDAHRHRHTDTHTHNPLKAAYVRDVKEVLAICKECVNDFINACVCRCLQLLLTARKLDPQNLHVIF